MARYPYEEQAPKRKGLTIKKVFVFFIVVILICYPFVEASIILVDEEKVYVSGLDSSLNNLRIMFVSDIHSGPFFDQSRVDALVERINSFSPDIVIMGGDYASSSDGAIAFFENLPKINAKIGTYVVLGNNDRTVPESNLQVLQQAIKDYGATPLVNSVATITRGNATMYILGVDDYYNGYPDVSGVASKVCEDDFVIFVGHSPDLMPDLLDAKGYDGDSHWFDLALFGHTHGGQISIPGTTLITNVDTEVGERYLSGWITENRASILVSNGVGTSGVPMRLFAPPQIHLITIKAE